MNLQLNHHFPQLDQLQTKYGSTELHAVYGAGCTDNPDIMLMFMNPTAKNVSAHLNWDGLRAPWLGTKNVWRMLNKLKFIDNNVFEQISTFKPAQWTNEFSIEVYNGIALKKLYITNLAKCTQLDASHLNNSVFKEYLNQTLEEIYAINPKKIITFGTQVSSVLLSKPVKVSEYLDNRAEKLKISDKVFDIYPSYYPVGQGTRNIHKAIERINAVLYH